jgi:phospho-N-acetylmuramoyl-pentapeptide-transferase
MEYFLTKTFLSCFLSTNWKFPLSFFSTFLITACAAKPFIAWAKSYCSTAVRNATPMAHQKKNGIPTMGGLLLVVVITINLLWWSNVRQLYVWCELLVFLGFAFIGLCDDWCKIYLKKGISARSKFASQWFFALLVVGCAYYGNLIPLEHRTLGVVLLFSWISFIIVGTSNAVNLTDGLDGLATQVLLPQFFVLVCIGYGAGLVHVPIDALQEVGIAATIVCAALLAFLWFNCYPAQIFMGDVGSLSLGALLAFLSLMLGYEWFLVLSGFVLVVETISVLMQVCSFRLFGKKLFRLAPIHHHFELAGVPEATITTRATILTCVLSVLAYYLFVVASKGL